VTVNRQAVPAAVTVVITTKDEELHVGRCLDSALPLGRAIVLDGGSEDATVEIARAHGAEVVEHLWEGYSAQKNWALENLPIKTEWVLFLDADEYLTEDLRTEITAAVKADSIDGLYVARENIVLGRRLRHAWWYPDYQMRLFLRRKGHYEKRLVHEHAVIDGKTDFLRTPLLHENLKGVTAWMERHIRYAALEAAEMRKARAGERSGDVNPRFFGSRAERRRAVKTRIWYRMPFRPAIRFFWLYVIKRGFLDGRQGRIYCQLLAAYEALIDANLLELDLREEREARKS
jgi:glycosyltransferase involved in cell wall biosynthesis